MSKQLWVSLLLGLGVAGIVVGFMILGTKGNQVTLTGTILKVRVLPLSAEASLVTVDFRVNNPSDVPFVVESCSLTLDPAKGDTLDGMNVSKSDMENVFKYNPILGPKFNDVLIIKDTVKPHEHMDRMVGARFEIPESQAEERKAVHLHIQEIDGTAVDFTEKNN